MTAFAHKDLDTAAAARSLPSAGQPGFGQDDIAQLAYLNWQKDGCPAGQDLQYWQEAEAQLKVTWHLLTAGCDATIAAEVLAEFRLTDLALAFGEDRLLKEA